MNSKFKSVVKRAAVGVALVVSSASAFAIDISAEVTAAKTDIATIGALILGVVVAVAAVGWVRRVIR